MRIRIASEFAIALGLLGTIFATDAEARITKIVITSVETPTFGATTFGINGAIGAYEKLRGTAFGEVDPAEPHIVDLGLAPRTPRARSGTRWTSTS